MSKAVYFFIAREDFIMKRFPQLIPDCNVLIVGLGLIGTAYAKALSEKGYRVLGITRSSAVIETALADGIIAEGSTTPDPELIQQADLLIFGLYPTVLIDWIRENGRIPRTKLQRCEISEWHCLS